MNGAKRDGLFLALVLGLGCLQMLGWALEDPALQSAGKATVASPLPLVFSTHEGLETFAQEFSIEIRHGEEVQTITLDAERYQSLTGSYNRRNTYGALFSHGALLEKHMPDVLSAALHYGVCDPGALMTECGLPSEFDSIVVEAKPQATPNSPWRKEVKCP